MAAGASSNNAAEIYNKDGNKSDLLREKCIWPALIFLLDDSLSLKMAIRPICVSL